MAPDFAQGAASADAWSMNGPKGGVPSTASHAQQEPKPKLIPTQSAHRCVDRLQNVLYDFTALLLHIFFSGRLSVQFCHCSTGVHYSWALEWKP